jgi:hypothetical protein
MRSDKSLHGKSRFWWAFTGSLSVGWFSSACISLLFLRAAPAPRGAARLATNLFFFLRPFFFLSLLG